ncbi:NAD(P)-dependent dehydrogenase (short-subunit alcohol dehydrogenase family) [Sphingobium fontiphilum]|uniref:NAD(P)-dependent dehydrogenase (Short-subunit alcohol dehydrogenase family) n=1 Tax=Sphingobium fontiphilum TaxID=944425 RepID=A0A7W6GPI1_9SPHN|nr:SDR family oxidoreductase [Sphingobium fontiphilum]MBB3981034.1 NAD(P)-dependent dehydrogenase (short-subunit alcohol dehydrogenase family) [Sphingobium fontiphilum]
MSGKTDLTGAVALVTGATGGIGRATVAALADSGAQAIATDVARQADVAGAALYAPLDVTSPEDWASVIARIEQYFGRLDILVNNAGISVTNSIADTTLAEFRKCMAINVEGVFLGTQAAQPLLARSGVDRDGGSSIINLSSVGGLRGAAFMSTYCASKGAVKLYSKSAALEFAMLKLPIRVNSVHPGGIDTNMMDTIFARYVDEGVFPDLETARGAVSAGHAMSRMGQPDEIAQGIAYLASPAASFMTGSELVIDGGMTAH